MKKGYACSFIISLLIVIFPFNGETNIVLAEEQSTSDSSSVWHENWDEGVSAAKREKKPILVDFMSYSCGACVVMDEKTFAAPEIKKLLSADWVCIKVNTHHRHKSGTFDGKTMNYFQLAKYFRVSAVPTFLFIDKEGKPVQSLVGYQDKELFGDILDYMKDEAHKRGIPFEEYRKSKEISEQ